MQQSIEWHKNCLKNREINMVEKELSLSDLSNIIGKEKTGIALYSAQINLAEKEQKNEFDRDKYAIKRLCV